MFSGTLMPLTTRVTSTITRIPRTAAVRESTATCAVSRASSP